MSEPTKPNHYQNGTKDVIERMADIDTDFGIIFCIGNMVKYGTRAGLKEDQFAADIDKIRTYVYRLNELLGDQTVVNWLNKYNLAKGPENSLLEEFEAFKATTL